MGEANFRIFAGNSNRPLAEEICQFVGRPLGDATVDDVADAHQRDLLVQDKYGVRYMSYWFNDPEGKAFCLVEAPTSDAAKACHKEAHGLMPHDIIEVGATTTALDAAVAEFAGNLQHGRLQYQPCMSVRIRRASCMECE